MKKTNAVRLLDKAKVSYELIEYTVDENDLAAGHIAEELGQNLSQVFKTLVLKGNKTGHIVAVIPGDKELNLKKLAKVSGNKSVEMVAVKELLGLTGYIRGGCSPIGMKKKYPTYINSSCQLFDYIMISAGVRGMQMKLNPLDLLDVTGAEIEELTM